MTFGEKSPGSGVRVMPVDGRNELVGFVLEGVTGCPNVDSFARPTALSAPIFSC